MTGVEFESPVAPELAAHIAQLLTTNISNAEGF
jgi:hypothetical protein